MALAAGCAGAADGSESGGGGTSRLSLLKDKAKLTAVLTCHVVPGAVMAKNVKSGIQASNGVIHVIDAVLLPK
jgi:uncharacterized surface protein with fasciclin (FAS1) repeats